MGSDWKRDGPWLEGRRNGWIYRAMIGVDDTPSVGVGDYRLFADQLTTRYARGWQLSLAEVSTGPVADQGVSVPSESGEPARPSPAISVNLWAARLTSLYGSRTKRTNPRWAQTLRAAAGAP